MLVKIADKKVPVAKDNNTYLYIFKSKSLHLINGFRKKERTNKKIDNIK